MSTCEVCPNQGTLRCTGCAESHYCSKQCQKRGWIDHKHLCKALAAFRTPPSTSDKVQGYTRAIYFPVGDEKPRFEWLPYSSAGENHIRVSLKGLMAVTEEEHKSERYEVAGWLNVNVAMGLGRFVPHVVRILYRTNAEEPNKTIPKICDERSQYIHRWKGPVIAYGIKRFTADDHIKQASDLTQRICARSSTSSTHIS